MYNSIIPRFLLSTFVGQYPRHQRPHCSACDCMSYDKSDPLSGHHRKHMLETKATTFAATRRKQNHIEGCTANLRGAIG